MSSMTPEMEKLLESMLKGAAIDVQFLKGPAVYLALAMNYNTYQLAKENADTLRRQEELFIQIENHLGEIAKCIKEPSGNSTQHSLRTSHSY